MIKDNELRAEITKLLDAHNSNEIDSRDEWYREMVYFRDDVVKKLNIHDVVGRLKVYDIETDTVHDFVGIDNENRVVMNNEQYGSTSNTLDKVRFIQL